MPSLSDLNNAGFPTNPNHQPSHVSPEQAAGALYAAGFRGDDWVKILAHTWGESGFDASAIGDTQLLPSEGPSLGLWQLNASAHFARMVQYNAQYGVGWWKQPYYNALMAKELWSSQGEGAWAGSQASANQHYNDAKMTVAALQQDPNKLNTLADAAKKGLITVADVNAAATAASNALDPTQIIKDAIKAAYDTFFGAPAPGKVSVIGRFAYFVAGSISLTLAFVIWGKNSPAVRSAVNVGVTAASRGAISGALPQPKQAIKKASEAAAKQATKSTPTPKPKSTEPTISGDFGTAGESVKRTGEVIKKASK
jgi:hypothetical protein